MIEQPARRNPGGPLAGLVPPGAPPELRARVLAASRAALLTAARTARPRGAFSGAVVRFASRGRPPSSSSSPRTSPSGRMRGRRWRPALLALGDADAELAAVGRLPRLDRDARPSPPARRRATQAAQAHPDRKPEENRT